MDDSINLRQSHDMFRSSQKSNDEVFVVNSDEK